MILYPTISLATKFDSAILYLLAHSVSPEERSVVLGDWSCVHALLQMHWPEIYTWLGLNSNDRWDWDLGIEDDSKLVLILCAELSDAFNQAWCEDIA
jgi:hypothetical protein